MRCLQADSEFMTVHVVHALLVEGPVKIDDEYFEC